MLCFLVSWRQQDLTRLRQERRSTMKKTAKLFAALSRVYVVVASAVLPNLSNVETMKLIVLGSLCSPSQRWRNSGSGKADTSAHQTTRTSYSRDRLPEPRRSHCITTSRVCASVALPGCRHGVAETGVGTRSVVAAKGLGSVGLQCGANGYA